MNMEIGTQYTTTNGEVANRPAVWGGVLAMSLGAFALVASEFMPVSLLTPIAADPHISEGQAGQAISVSGAFALLTSLFISSLAGRLDRKGLLLSLTLLMIVSGTVVAFAHRRCHWRLLVDVGGNGDASCAEPSRSTRPGDRERRKCAGDGGGCPLGSFLGAIIGWRGAFFCVVPIAAIALGWKFLSLPSMTAERGTNSLAIMSGATVGGVVFDRSGNQATFEMSAALLVIATGLAILTARAGSPATAGNGGRVKPTDESNALEA
ncbi:MAG TPA: hypothetical protein VIT91_14720 [Chthoniobacterales bacterium]